MLEWLDARRRWRTSAPFLDDDPFTRVMAATAFFGVALFVVILPAQLLDPRVLDGAPVWLKPQKFNVSMTVHFLTLAYLAQMVPRAVRTGPTLMVFGYLAVAAMAFEQVYMHLQAARGRRSHFNFDTPIEGALYALMGIGALVLVFVAIALAVQIARKSPADRPGLRLGAALGLSVGALATIGFGGYMSMSGSHHVGIHPEGGAELAFFGWSREVGDLRPAHFVTLHMMQSLPFVGWLTDRFNGAARPAVWLACAVQAGLAAALFVQALAGRPFWPAG